MSKLSRRSFLKALGLTGTAAVTGCSSESARKLIPYIVPPEDIIPGEATWYATTCRECPAGCGILAKNRDGHVIKVEGNPLHPVNQGRLCARGQASLQGLYNPDRIKRPQRRIAQDRFELLTWEQGEDLLIRNILPLVEKGRGERIVFITDLVTGSLKDIIVLWLSQMGSGSHVIYEPLSYEPLKRANHIIFGVDGIPSYRIDHADFLISFGVDFLETWLSNVEYARQFAAFHAPGESSRPPFVYVGPRLSLTAANADHWISVPPGTEFLVALGMLRVILEENPGLPLAPDQKSTLGAAIVDWPLSEVVARTGVKEETIRSLARSFAHAKIPLALAGGATCSGAHATEAAVAANLLCTVAPGTRKALDFDGMSALGETRKAQDLKVLSERMERGDVDLLMIHNANPVFSLPASWNFPKGIQAVPFVVSFSSTMDETSQYAHVCLPVHTPLESWGDHSPNRGIWGIMQPVMGPVFNTRHLGDLLLSTGRKVKGSSMFPWEDFYQMMQYLWRQKGRRQSPNTPFETFWIDSLKRGGTWEINQHATSGPTAPSPRFSFPQPEVVRQSEKDFHFITYPSIQFFDGRSANRPWLQELPDPLSMITWGNWIEIHPETADKLGIRKGDLLRLETAHGSVEAPAFPYPGIHPDTLAMPLGQGHTRYGRFADHRSVNPAQILSPEIDPSCGGLRWVISGVGMTRLGRAQPVANTDGSSYQHGRGIAQAVSFDQYDTARKREQAPSLRLPLPQGYDAKDDLYSPHNHPEYRWIMVVDLDRCIGCGACVVSCYAENNIPIVGKEHVLRGREMAWLRIERYFEKEEPWVRFVPMLCQHCDSAPCESVCPMFAPHHSVDGLNNQVYNRCIGTFFCSQNCPYKVRRFNWFTFPRYEPLNWQLNPDVTVRHKGVMEKCSFCIQRIVKVKNRARSEDRKVRDGEVIPACVQTCPTDALVFGNLRDPESRVSRLIRDPRAYQVFESLNTKPGVIYLKKLKQSSVDI
jgi:anaerobic selenocysteine-containing dehydrogenase/Fe-S-cluster-containing dehydrogenase component